MPIEKFREFADADAAASKRGRDRNPGVIAARLRAVCAIASLTSPHRYARGVRKFRTVEDAMRDRERDEAISRRR